VLITDSEIDDASRSEFTQRGVEVVVA
jgi:hypothetical protein